MSYKILLSGLIQLHETFIPQDPDNRDYQAYLSWLKAGNTPETEQPATAPAHNYFGFYQGLLGEALPLFLFVRSIADLNLPVSNAYTDLMGAIQFQQFAGFQSSILVLFASLQTAGYAFSPEQIIQMRTLLNNAGFSDIVFPINQDAT